MLTTIPSSYRIHQGTASFIHPTKKPPDISDYGIPKPRKHYNNVSARKFNDSKLLMLVEDFSDYFYSKSKQDIPLGHNETLVTTNDIYPFGNCSLNGTFNITCIAQPEMVREYNYWALLLLVFPFFTLFGNVLVIMSVVRERTLQTVTNYFIVSLAVADLLVAVVVMPFGVYYLVVGSWALPSFMCDFYIAMDVTSSTSSIFNLVAISVDRYIAVTQPIKYAKHKNNRRVWLTILLVWLISAAIGSPVVLGLNDTPDRNFDECLFNSQNYVIYSSLGSFYIPCIMMMFLYYSIFKALKERVKKQRAAKRPPGPCSNSRSGTTAAVVIESVGQHKRFAETVLHEMPTNTGSGSNEEDHEDSFDKRSVIIEVDGEGCQISNDKSTEFILATVVEETSNSNRHSKRGISDPNGNSDSSYVQSNVEAGSPSTKDTALLQGKDPVFKSSMRKNGKPRIEIDNRKLSVQLPPPSGEAATSRDAPKVKKERKASAATARFTIYKANKASKKKREKSSAKKERKATKTLAIVLGTYHLLSAFKNGSKGVLLVIGVFLICWTPFFTCNVMDAICTKLIAQCSPGVTVFIMTTWLGYINSFLNPVIYTIFNPEFRKAFRKILRCG